MPLSDEGGGFCEAKDGGREKDRVYLCPYLVGENIKIYLSLTTCKEHRNSAGSCVCADNRADVNHHINR